MIDHIVLTVQNVDQSKALYLKALKPLGYGLVKEYPGGAGFRADGQPSFWIGDARPGYWTDAHGVSKSPTHVALQAPSRAAVRAFHAAALEAGGKDYGTPGIRASYHPNYYGAFVLDPDGNNLGAVINTPE
ncbi:MAG: VOC family protein [Polyangiaceae bacterium]|jgi:catechol 2,3-dioxygenase-like lactoylglutathione lyase family enzyme